MSAKTPRFTARSSFNDNTVARKQLRSLATAVHLDGLTSTFSVVTVPLVFVRASTTNRVAAVELNPPLLAMSARCRQWTPGEPVLGTLRRLQTLTIPEICFRLSTSNSLFSPVLLNTKTTSPAWSSMSDFPRPQSRFFHINLNRFLGRSPCNSNVLDIGGVFQAASHLNGM